MMSRIPFGPMLTTLAAVGLFGCTQETVEPCEPVEPGTPTEVDCDCPLDTSSPVDMNLPDCWQDLSEFGVALDTAYRFTWQGVDMGHAATFSEGHLTLDLMGTITYTLDTDIIDCRIHCTIGNPNGLHDGMVLRRVSDTTLAGSMQYGVTEWEPDEFGDPVTIFLTE